MNRFNSYIFTCGESHTITTHILPRLNSSKVVSIHLAGSGAMKGVLFRDQEKLGTLFTHRRGLNTEYKIPFEIIPNTTELKIDITNYDSIPFDVYITVETI